MSGVTFVSVPGMVAASGFSYFQMALGFFVGQLVVAFVLIPLFYRMQLVSIYGYLEERFGATTYKTGAWFFFISKLLGASVRLFLVCVVLQLLLFDPYGIPFVANAAIMVVLVLLYTFQGGVKSLIWTDSLKTLCLILSIVLCIRFIIGRLDMSLGSMVSAVADSDYSRMVLARRPERPPLLLQTVLRRRVRAYRHDGSRPGFDAAQHELPQLP